MQDGRQRAGWLTAGRVTGNVMRDKHCAGWQVMCSVHDDRQGQRATRPGMASKAVKQQTLEAARREGGRGGGR